MTAPHDDDFPLPPEQTPEQAAAERHLDWALHETIGGETPPDLTARVLAELGTAPPAPAAHGTARRWLAAAALLLGFGAVLAVALWSRGRTADPQPVQAPIQDPAADSAPARVHTVADIAGLPADVTAIRADGIDDAVLAALAAAARQGRLPKLRSLEVHGPHQPIHGLGLKLSGVRSAPTITDQGLEHIAALSGLRRLFLQGTAGVIGSGLRHLARLPMLEELALRYQETDEQHLRELRHFPALRALDLSWNHGFHDLGTAAICQVQGLRRLSVRGCQQLDGALLARFGSLGELEDLDLGQIDGINWRWPGTDEAWPGKGLFERALAQRNAPRGPTDATLRALAALPKLRMLDVSGGACTGAGLAAFAGNTTLERLHVEGIALPADLPQSLPTSLRELHALTDLGAGFCASLRQHLPAIEVLDLQACDRLDDVAVAHLIALPKLRVLGLAQCRSLSPGCIDLLRHARQITDLDLRFLDWVKPEHTALLRDGMASLQVLQTDLEDPTAWLPQPLQVRTAAEAAALPATVRHVLLSDATDAVLAALPALPRLERLEVAAAWTLPIDRHKRRVENPPSVTDAGLGGLPALPALRTLVLRGQIGVRGSGLALVTRLGALRELVLDQQGVTDAGLAFLPHRPELERLELAHCQDFGKAGLQAIAACTALRELSLRGCSHLDDDAIVLLGGLRHLEHLDLSMIGSRTMFTGIRLNPLPEPPPGSGVTDRALAGLATLTRLRVLSLGQAGVTGDGLRHLAGMNDLRQLDLSGLAELRDQDLERVPAGVTRLILRGCPKLDAEVGPVLARAAPGLQTLDLLGCQGLDDECLAPLRELTALRYLDVSYCPNLTAAAAQRLRTLVRLQGLTVRGLPFGPAELAVLRELPDLRRLDTDAGTETLRR